MSDKHSNNNPNKKIGTNKNTPPKPKMKNTPPRNRGNTPPTRRNAKPTDKNPIHKPTKSQINSSYKRPPKETKKFEGVRPSQTVKNKNKPTKSNYARKPSDDKVEFQTMEEQERISEVDADAQTAVFFNRPLQSLDKEYSKPLTPAKAPISDYRRKVKRILFYVVTLVVLISICTVLSLTVFFKIDNIVVANNTTNYADDDIILASMIHKGDNLILCTTLEGEKKIEQTFPYIEDATITKQLFNQVTITIKKAVPTYIIESAGKYVVLSESGKVIEVNDQRKYNDVPMINGAKLKDVKMSSTIQYQSDNIRKYVDELIGGIKKYKIKNIKTIDISSLTKIKLVNANGFTIIIGNPENIDYKIKTASVIISKSVQNNAKGTLDVSLASADGGKSYLSSEQESSENSVESSTESTAESSLTQGSAEGSVPQTSTEQSVTENTQTSTQSSVDNGTSDSTAQGGVADPTVSDASTAESTYPSLTTTEGTAMTTA